LRAGTLNGLLDADQPRGSHPPVRSNTEPPSVLAESSKRATPWLFRRVNAPVSPTPPTTRYPERGVDDVLGLGRPPSYRTAQESYLSKEMSTGAREIQISPAETTLPRSPTNAPRGLAWPNRPNGTTAPSHAASNLGQSSLGSATTESERSRPGITRCVPPPSSTHPPQYRSRESSFTPTLPPYSVTGRGFSPSNEPQPQDLSRKPSSALSSGESHFALPSDPLLPESAVSRIQAAYKVSNELGNAVRLQEVRVATPITLNPRATRRFVSVTEMEDLRKVDAHVDRRSGEREARQRALSKPSECCRRNRDGKIHRTASERVNPVKMRDVSRR
jgi:hypothetical protein